VSDPDDDYRSDAQREWANWAAHGYRKMYQPRSMRLFGVIFFTLFGLGLLTVFVLAANGRWP